MTSQVGAQLPMPAYVPSSNLGQIGLIKRDLFIQTGAKTYPMSTLYFEYGDPKLFWESVKSFYPDLAGAVDLRQRGVSYAGDARTQARVQTLAKNWDKPSRQLRFEVEVVEVNTQILENHRGVYSDPLYMELTSQTVLAHLISSGNAKLLARPTLRVLDGHRGVIRVGDQVPYVTRLVHQNFTAEEVHFVDSGIELTLQPQGVSHSGIHLSVQSVMNVVKSWENLAGARYPVVSTRKADTKVILKPGKPYVLAGLYDEQKRSVETGIPILKSLPWIGSVFTQTHDELYRTDVVMVITPWVE
jgi:type II secretory pathway component HofQ